MVLLVYVDDIVLIGSHPHLLSHLVFTLQHSFALKDLGPLTYFLGIEVTSYPGVLHLSQGKYIRDLLTRVHMHNAKPCSSPMITGQSLSKYQGDLFENLQLYRTIIGALQYATITRPDIAFAVNKVSQFMHTPTTDHWMAVKRILKYLVGCPTYGLTLQTTNNLQLHAFSDSDWAGCPDDRRSTSGFCIFLGSNLVSWSSKKHKTLLDPVLKRSTGALLLQVLKSFG
jgi:Reverse transcriptase (RNA-dependent DNA polymerase)